MADDDLTFSTGDVSGTSFQAHTVHGNVYLNGSEPPVAQPACAPPATWAETTDLPAEVARLLWAQEQAADLLPYELPGARTPSLGTVYVRQGLGGGVEDTSPDHAKPTLIPDEHGRLVEIPVVSSVRLTVRPPAKSMRTALDTDPHLVVLGGPGHGKSTLTLRLTAEIVSNWSRKSDGDDAPLAEPVIPLRITARTLAHHLGSSFTQALADCAFAEYGRYLNGPIDPSFFGDRVAGCRWLLLVDALDEVADGNLRATLVHTLSSWASQPTYRVLLTTRPTEGGALAALQQRAGAARYDLQPFDREALGRFARSWFAEVGEGYADRFLHEVREAHLDELVEVPLLATIAAIVFEQYSERPLPGNKFELYECYLEYIRRDREAVGAFDHHRVALIEHLGRTRLTTDGSLALAVHEWALQHEVAHVDALITYLSRVGPFRKRGNDISFLHHSFAEHVAATAAARELPTNFAAEHGDFPELLHTARPEESGRFARAVLLHYTHLHVAEADRLLRWLHAGGAEEHLLAARLLARHLPATTPEVHEFLVTARAWAETSKYPARQILQKISRATRYPGLIEWLADLMHADAAPWNSRAEAAIALAVRLRCSHTEAAVGFLRAALDDRSASVDERLTAAEALAHSGSSEADAAERGLRSVVDDPCASGADCRNAAVVLAAFDGEARAHAVAALYQLVSDEDTPADDLVEAATGLLEIDVEFHSKSAEVFLGVLRDRAHGTDGRRDAAIGLASLGRKPEAVEALRDLFCNLRRPTGFRYDAASALALLGPQERVLAGDLLLSELTSPSTTPADKVDLAPELARLGHREVAVTTLRDLLARASTPWSNVASAASTLAEFGPTFREEAAAHFEEILSQSPPRGPAYTRALRELADLGEPHRSTAVTRMAALVADPAADGETRCGVASNLIRSAPELRDEVTRHLVSITRTEQDPAVLCQVWLELRRLGSDLLGQAKQAMLVLAMRDREGGAVPQELGMMFRWYSATDQAAAADVLREVAADESRGLRTRLSAVYGLLRLGRRFHREAVDIVCGMITAGRRVDLPYVAFLVALLAGPGVRDTLATTIRGVLKEPGLQSNAVWSAIEALDVLGYQATDDDLRRVADDGSVDNRIRAEAALELTTRGVACHPSAASLVFRAADDLWINAWQPLVARLAALGVDVRAEALALIADPRSPLDARATAAAFLEAEGAAVLRELLSDPYLGLVQRQLVHRLTVCSNLASSADAVSECLGVVNGSDESMVNRSFAALMLARTDRHFTGASIAVLWQFADGPSFRADERVVAVERLCDLEVPASPRLVQTLTRITHLPEVDASSRQRLTGHLPRASRTLSERVSLADHTSPLSKRVPQRDGWDDLPLHVSAEAAVRDVLEDPTATTGERRMAAVQLAHLAAEHVPEAVGLLLADGSPKAMAEVAKLGHWQRVREFVLDAERPARERRATVLRLRAMADDSAVREMMIEDEQLSWRDQVDVLQFLQNHDELRRVRDNRSGMPAQRWRAALALLNLTSADRAAAARLAHDIAKDSGMRSILRYQVANKLASFGAQGKVEGVLLLQAMANDRRVSPLARSWCANQVRAHSAAKAADMLEVQRRLAETASPLVRTVVLSSMSWAPSWDSLEELLRTAEDRKSAPRVRLLSARRVVARQRDLKDRCAVVARGIALDSEAPWHIRLRAAKCLSAWSEVVRADARELARSLKAECASGR